jgi:hypothetical protein
MLTDCVTIHLTITLLYDGSKWVALLERQEEAGYSVCEVVCGYSEPLLAEVHQLLLAVHRTLVFSAPEVQDDGQATRPVNFKRMQRESRRMMEESDALVNVRDAAREDRARRKAEKAAEERAAREQEEALKYKLKQDKKKAKQRGH